MVKQTKIHMSMSEHSGKLLEGLLRIKIHGETWLMHTYTVVQWHEISRHVPPVVGVIMHWLHICYLCTLLGHRAWYGSVVVIRYSSVLEILARCCLFNLTRVSVYSLFTHCLIKTNERTRFRYNEGRLRYKVLRGVTPHNNAIAEKE